MAVRHREEGTLGRGQRGEEEDNRKVFYHGHGHSTGNVTFDDYMYFISIFSPECCYLDDERMMTLLNDFSRTRIFIFILQKGSVPKNETIKNETIKICVIDDHVRSSC